MKKNENVWKKKWKKKWKKMKTSEKKMKKKWKKMKKKPKMRFLIIIIESNKVEPVTVARTQPWHYPTIIGLSNAIANNVQYGDFLDSVMFHGWLHDAFVCTSLMPGFMLGPGSQTVECMF